MRELEKHVKAVVEKVYSSEIKGISEALSLHHVPILEWESTIDEGVMHTQRWYTAINDGYTHLVDKATTDYKIHVNTYSLGLCINNYKLLFGKDVEEDLILIFLAHECRHIWQVESSWWHGRLAGNRNVVEHGSLPEEQDANAFAIAYVQDERIQALAEYVKFLQDKGNTARRGEVQEIYKKSLSIYNPSHCEILEFLGL